MKSKAAMCFRCSSDACRLCKVYWNCPGLSKAKK